MSRRRFLRQAATGVSLLLGASVPYGLAQLLSPEPARAPEERRHRPLPGALKDAADFSAACIGCGLCSEVCPPNCILFHEREGGEVVNTPYINPEYKGCILCGKCMQVCPTEALTETPRERVDMGIAQIDRLACYPWVDRGICGACVGICPLGERAIRFKMWNQYRPVVQQGCVGCGLCVEVCPHPSLPIRIVDRSEGTVTRHRI